MSAGATISFNLTIIDDNVADDNYFYFYYYYYPGEVGIDLGIYQSDGTVYCNYSYIRIEDNDGKELHYIAIEYQYNTQTKIILICLNVPFSSIQPL